MNIFYTKYRKHFELCDELLSLAIRLLPLIPAQSKTYAEVITAFFIKALNSFRSVISLCKEGLGDDACLIVRSLLNLSYLVKWTEEEKEDRTKRFLGWYLNQKIQLLKDLGKTPSVELEREWAEIRNLFEYTDENGKTRLVRCWYGNKNIVDLAQDLKEGKTPPDGYKTHADYHYEGYRILSNIEHSNPLALTFFLEREKGQYLVGYLSQDELIHEALKGGFQYFYLILDAWNSHFDVISSEEIRELLERAKEYFKQFERNNQNGQREVSSVSHDA